jgi:hypothetical protein
VAAVPATLALLFLVIQVSLWFYGRTVATAAAQHGLDAARVVGGNESAGEDTVIQFVDQVGGLEVSSVSVDFSSGGTVVTVTVVGDVVSVLPSFVAPITVTLEAPVERVVG